jgi:hypothetical protein
MRMLARCLFGNRRSVVGDPYDGHKQPEQPEQPEQPTTLLQTIGVAPSTVIVDMLSWRGRDLRSAADLSTAASHRPCQERSTLGKPVEAMSNTCLRGRGSDFTCMVENFIPAHAERDAA